MDASPDHVNRKVSSFFIITVHHKMLGGSAGILWMIMKRGKLGFYELNFNLNCMTHVSAWWYLT